MDSRFHGNDCLVFIVICPDFRINIYQMVDMPGFSYTVGAEIPKEYVG
ncbi:hypothetical protein ACFL50_00065 [Candidatus Latescibacterota bacterium]